MTRKNGGTVSSGNVILAILLAACLQAAAQVAPKPPVSTPSAGGNSFDGPGAVAYQAGRDSQDRRIDMFMGDWRDSMPRHLYGSLVIRDILTRGDNFSPPQPGAILQAANFLALGRMQPGASTTPSRLEHAQNIFYVVGGSGRNYRGREDGSAAQRHRDLYPREHRIPHHQLGQR